MVVLNVGDELKSNSTISSLLLFLYLKKIVKEKNVGRDLCTKSFLDRYFIVMVLNLHLHLHIFTGSSMILEMCYFVKIFTRL